MMHRTKHPLTDPSSHLSPCAGERKSSAGTSTPFQLGFLSPGPGERWRAKRDGEGVLGANAGSQRGRS
jgi:hypothetical protein